MINNEYIHKTWNKTKLFLREIQTTSLTHTHTHTDKTHTHTHNKISFRKETRVGHG